MGKAGIWESSVTGKWKSMWRDPEAIFVSQQGAECDLSRMGAGRKQNLPEMAPMETLMKNSCQRMEQEG